MKKIICCILLLCVMFAFSSCNNYEIADDYTESKIENGYNNYLAGGSLALINSRLYSYNLNGFANIEALVISKHGKRYMLSREKRSFLGLSTRFFLYNNTIYCMDVNTGSLYWYVNYNKGFKKSNIDVEGSMQYYISDNLIIYFADEYKLSVSYKGKETTLDLDAVRFYPVDNTVYVITDKGGLYRYKLLSSDGECEYIAELAYDGAGSVFAVCGDYIYYDDYNIEASANELWRYSLSDNKKKKIISDKEVLSVNMYDESFYFIVDNHLYVDDLQGEPQRVTDVNVDEVYIFGDKWIYLKKSNGEIYRTTHDGEITEKVFG